MTEYLNAELYDLRNKWAKDDDFYLEFSKNIKGDILDLGCGTGRLTREIAELGNRVVGLDVEKSSRSWCWK